MFTLVLGLLLGPALTFEDALARAERSPAVEAWREAARSRRTLARDVSRLVDNPQVQAQVGARDLAAGGRGAELYLGASQSFSLAGAGRRRLSAVAREVAVDEREVDLSLQGARIEAARAWLRCWAAKRRLELAAHEQRLTAELAQAMQVRLDASEATLVDVEQVRLWESEAALTVLAAEDEVFEAGVELARVLGERQPEPLSVAGDLPALDVPAHEVLEATRGALPESPEEAAAEARAQAVQARMEEVKAVRGTTLGIGAMGWREGGGDVAGVLTLNLQVPLFERGERELAGMAAELRQREGEAVRRRLEVRAERTRLAHHLEHTARMVHTLRTQALQHAESLAEAERMRLEASEGTALQWVLARRGMLGIRHALVNAQVEHTLARFLVRERWHLNEESR